MNIVVITSHYPVINNNIYTYADHYLVKEWIKSNHNVRVYFLLSCSFLRHGNRIQREDYFFEGVSVNYIRYPRYIPKSAFVTEKIANIVGDMLIRDLKQDCFVPDLFYCDFCSANWRIIEFLKKERYFLSSQFVPVFNNCDFNNYFEAKKIINSATIIGVRSEAQKKRVLNIRNNAKVFVALSGIPNSSVSEKNEYKIYPTGEQIKIIYVGDLIPLKNVDVVLMAIKKLLVNWNVYLTIIGDGPERKRLSTFVNRNNLATNVCFKGRISREDVLKCMGESDIFVMVSKPESFGMVYVEAMSQGCFVIGCKDEGIDGVIINGKNGALVKPRDVQDLTDCINSYLELSIDKQMIIRKEAKKTALLMTEMKVAQKVLDDILRLRQEE